MFAHVERIAEAIAIDVEQIVIDEEAIVTDVEQIAIDVDQIVVDVGLIVAVEDATLTFAEEAVSSGKNKLVRTLQPT